MNITVEVLRKLSPPFTTRVIPKLNKIDGRDAWTGVDQEDKVLYSIDCYWIFTKLNNTIWCSLEYNIRHGDWS